MFVVGSSVTADANTSPRHPRAAATVTSSYRFNNSPKNRHNTVHLKAVDGSSSAVVDRDSLLAGAEIDGIGGGGKKSQKLKIKRKGLDRSSTFKGRGEDKKEKEKEKERAGGIEAVDSVAQQQLLACAMRMKDSLEELVVRHAHTLHFRYSECINILTSSVYNHVECTCILCLHVRVYNVHVCTMCMNVHGLYIMQCT